jgi:hypothetical protein
MGESMVPERKTDPLAPPLGPAKVKSQEGVPVIMVHDRNRRNWRAGPLGHEETFGIARVERCRIVETRVPPLIRSLVEHQVYVCQRRRPHPPPPIPFTDKAMSS